MYPVHVHPRCVLHLMLVLGISSSSSALLGAAQDEGNDPYWTAQYAYTDDINNSPPNLLDPIPLDDNDFYLEHITTREQRGDDIEAQHFKGHIKHNAKQASRTFDEPWVDSGKYEEAMSSIDIGSVFAEGDLDESLRVGASKDPRDFEGTWVLINQRSESTDEILKALGVGLVRRRYSASYPPETSYTVKSYNEERPVINISTRFSPTVVKEGTIRCNGDRQEFKDSDTGDWQSICIWHNGRMMQRRDSLKGVMYDVRTVYHHDPQNVTRGPVHLFKWTFIPKNSNVKYVSHRWMKPKPTMV